MKLEEIDDVALFGAGTMGSSIALALARDGYQITVIDRNDEALQRSRAVASSALDLLVDKEAVAEDERDTILNRIRFTSSAEQAARQADLVVECIIEERTAKQELYADLDQWCPEHTIFASNTSYLNIFELMPERRLPNTVIAHWFAPAHIVPLVEVVGGEETTTETLDLTVQWLKSAHRVPIVMKKFVEGFCVNRLQRILGREIFFLLDNDYISPEMLDIAVKASIVPRAMVLGLVQRYDFTGLDLSYDNLQNPDYIEPPFDNQPKSLAARVEQGELGVKTGKGFFDYSGEPLVDVLRRRDERLLEVFESVGGLINKRI